MSITTITAGQISRSLPVAPAAVVTISPQSGATATVEYTRDSAANIRNGSAKWQAWPKGPVTQSATEMANNAIHMRVTALGGTVVINVDDSVNSDAQIAQRADWGPRAFVRYGPTGNVVGVVAPDGTLISLGGSPVAAFWSASGLLPDGTAVVVPLGGSVTSIYRAAANPTSGDSVLVESATSSAGPWSPWPLGSVSAPDSLLFYPGQPATTHMRFTRSSGSGTTSRWYLNEIATGA